MCLQVADDAGFCRLSHSRSVVSARWAEVKVRLHISHESVDIIRGRQQQRTERAKSSHDERDCQRQTRAQPLHHLRGTVACLLYTRPTWVVPDKQPLNGGCCCCGCYFTCGWLGSRVVSVLDSGAEGPGFKSQPRRCRVTVLGKLFTPILPLFTKQQITRGVMKLMITGQCLQFQFYHNTKFLMHAKTKWTEYFR